MQRKSPLPTVKTAADKTKIREVEHTVSFYRTIVMEPLCTASFGEVMI
jgi:hypothetical protein